MEGVGSVEFDPVLETAPRDAVLDADPSVPRQVTLTPGWNLLVVLQGTLALVDLRAMNLTTLLFAGVVGVWTQLHAFSAGAPAVLAWLAWALLIVALVVMARVMLPHRLARLGDSVILSSELPCQFEPAEEADVLARASLAVRAELEWLRKHLQVSVALGLLALAQVVVAYVIQKA